MAKWIQRSAVASPGSGSSRTVAFTPAAAGSELLLAAASGSAMGLPSGWTLIDSQVGDSGLYWWRKTAVAGESSVTIPVNVAGWSVYAVVYEFASGTTFGTVSKQTAFPRSGTAVTGLSGMAATPKLLMHMGSFPATSPTWPVTGASWADATITDTWAGVAGGAAGDANGLLVGYLEDSVLTAWAPTNYLDDSTGLHYNTERMTMAVTVAAGGEPPEPTALDTPVVTVDSTVQPSDGLSNGSVTVSWPAVAGAVSYDAMIAPNGAPAQGDFTLVEAGVTSPHTFTGRAPGTASYGIIARA